MFNESSWSMFLGLSLGSISLRSEHFENYPFNGFSFENSFGFATGPSDMSAYDTWASLNGQDVDGHNMYTLLSGQPFEINMNAGQPDASSSAWVISVDDYCCENEWDTICQATYDYCEGTWVGPLPMRGVERKLIAVTDILGRPIKKDQTGVLIYIYSDGTIKRFLRNDK